MSLSGILGDNVGSSHGLCILGAEARRPSDGKETLSTNSQVFLFFCPFWFDHLPLQRFHSAFADGRDRRAEHPEMMICRESNSACRFDREKHRGHVSPLSFRSVPLEDDGCSAFPIGRTTAGLGS